MPHYRLPDFVGAKPELTTFQGKRCVSFKWADNTALRNALIAGGYQFLNYVFVPVNASCFRPPGSLDLEVYRIDTALKIGFLRETGRKFENMAFPEGTQAYVVDTTQPVDQQWADDMVGFCTGLIGAKTKTKWMNSFYADLSLGDEVTPYARRVALILNDSTLYPASPWPTPGWQTDGRDHVHVATNKLLNGDVVEMKEMLERYQWPSRMSVAIFFKRRPDDYDFLLNLLKKRAEKFCALYWAKNGGKLHTIQDVRWVDTSKLKYWNEYDKETFSKTCKAAKTRKHEYVPEEVYRSDFGRKSKVEIEDISTATLDL